MSTEQPTGAGERAPTEEEVQAALEEQMRRISVQDVLVQTAATLINLAARRLGLGPEESRAEEKDLEQARLAIEGARALLPLLGGDELAALRQPLSQLQMAYAQEARAAGAGEPGAATPESAGAAQKPPGGGPGGAPAPGAEPSGGPPPGEGDPDEAARERARAKIWTPPGS